MKIKLLIGIMFVAVSANAQNIKIPAVHSNIKMVGKKMVVKVDGIDVPHVEYQNPLTLENIRGKIVGTASGLYFDFNDEKFDGKLVFGLIPYGDSKHPMPVFYARSASIKTGKVAINISQQLRGRYDMVGWEKNKKGTIGYRILDNSGSILFDGNITFKGSGPFEVDDTILEGPFVNLVTDEGVTISFETNNEISTTIKVDDKEFKDAKAGTHHEILITGLEPNKKYDYTVIYGNNKVSYGFKTAPRAGSRTRFTFAYASDSRNGNGGGERNIYGVNAYITKKIMALATQQGVDIMQFTGDLIGGYKTSGGEMDLQYTNWKYTISPFAHYMPVVAAMGNHEALMHMFQDDDHSFMIDRFPYATESAEAAFARNFVNPTNGPESEDGASYDPNKKKIDFPSYKENAFYYTYDNLAIIVMNSDYWYAPRSNAIPHISGGLHGYIMDQQFAWLEETVAMFEKDDNIDHIFVTQHTPCFPNGGHTGDDMWYNGNNEKRPYVAGKPLEKGIIERRDQILDLLINKSKKTRAILTGDEHNFAKTEVGPNTVIYDENWTLPKLKLTRTIYQINNGAAGAPYYAQEQTPWTPWVSGFTTQNALVLFYIEGDSIEMEVLNPDTLEKVDELTLK